MNNKDKLQFLSTMGSTGTRTTKNRGRNDRNRTFDLGNTTISSPQNAKHLSFFGINETDVNIKPTLLETRLAQKDEFAKLSDGFKRAFANDGKDQKEFKIPVVGYTGHRKGEKSENLIGSNFRATTIQTKLNQRRATLSKTFYVGRHTSEVQKAQ